MPPTLAFVRDAARARVLDDRFSDRALSGVSIDSRTVESGMLFAAIAGPRFDGHDFIAKALEKGCAAVLAQRPPALPAGVRLGETPVLLVDDVLTALSRVGRAWRRRVDPLVVAVTGSCGKTTVKEMTAVCLRNHFRHVHATRGNFNNHIGLPLTLLAMAAECQALVVEMGMSGRGEIAHLAQLAEPDIGIITNIAAAHLDAFDTGLAGVADAKGELFAALPPNGHAILTAGTPFTRRLLDKTNGCAVTTFGETGADVTPEPMVDDPTRPFAIRWSDTHTAPFTLAAHGRHMVFNALAAAVAARVAGCPPAGIAAALDRFGPPPGRGRSERTAAGWVVIDDSYNANPGSVTAALAALPEPTGGGRRVAILGDMLELGKQAESLHVNLADPLLANRIDTVFCTGPRMGALHHALANRPGIDSHHQENAAAWQGKIQPLLRPGDVILIKGSRGMKMERIVEELAGHAF